MKKVFLTEEERHAVRLGREHISRELESSIRPPVSAVMNEISRLFIIAVKQTVSDTSLMRFSRMGILRYLDKNDESSQQDIAKYCRMSAPTISAELSDMEKIGLIARKHSENDARTILVSITDRGRALNARLKDAFRKAEDVMFSGISEQSRRLLADAITVMRNNVLEYIERNDKEGEDI